MAKGWGIFKPAGEGDDDAKLTDKLKQVEDIKKNKTSD